MSNFFVPTQVAIVESTLLLHNHIRHFDVDDDAIARHEANLNAFRIREVVDASAAGVDDPNAYATLEEWRDAIATKMWEDYQLYLTMHNLH
jgi:hypothetical protein